MGSSTQTDNAFPHHFPYSQKRKGTMTVGVILLYLKITSLKDLKEKASIDANKRQTLSHRNRKFKKYLWIMQFRAVLCNV